MKPQYKYENKLIIDAKRQFVIDCLLDYENYYNWQATLKRVELKKGQYKQENHLVNLVYDLANNQEMIMTETIVELKLPTKITFKYQVGTTMNLQYNYFESLEDKTVWKVETEFYFESDPPASLEIFKESTKQSLELFKEYVEKHVNNL